MLLRPSFFLLPSDSPRRAFASSAAFRQTGDKARISDRRRNDMASPPSPDWHERIPIVAAVGLGPAKKKYIAGLVALPSASRWSGASSRMPFAYFSSYSRMVLSLVSCFDAIVLIPANAPPS
jgi:hypothetical protein